MRLGELLQRVEDRESFALKLSNGVSVSEVNWRPPDIEDGLNPSPYDQNALRVEMADGSVFWTSGSRHWWREDDRDQTRLFYRCQRPGCESPLDEAI